MVGVLGLAIGLTTAMFTIVDALFLRPVPFKAPDQLAIVHMRGQVGGPLGVPPGVLSAWKRSSSFNGVEAARQGTAVIATEEGIVKRPIARVTPGLFNLLGGVRPVRGRLFDSSEALVGASDRILLSEDVWRALFHADPALLGRTIAIDERPATVIGILPSEFHFPEWNTAIWRVTNFDTTQADSPADLPTVYVRFGFQVPRTDALLAATAQARDVTTRYTKQWAEALPLATADKDFGRAVPLFVSGVVLLFVGLCANAGSLLLVGLTARGREFEMRLVLGASRARLVRQALFESAGACAGGVIVGIGVGWALVSAARVFVPRAFLLHSLNSLNIDMRALGVTSIAAVAALLCAGVLPAVIATRVEARSRSSQLSTRTGTETTRARAARRGLLVGQIAVTCTLLLGATLLVRSFVNLLTQDRGLDPSGILIATVVFPEKRFATQTARTMAGAEIAAQARAFAGVKRTSWSYGVPPSGGVKPSGAWISDVPGAQPIDMEVSQFAIDDDFLALYSLPILRGRALEPSDPPEGVLVSERFARALWPSGNPIDQSFSLNHKRRFRVIGVVKEIRYPALDKGLDTPQLYGTFRDVGPLSFLSIRCGTSCPDAALVEQRLAQLGADVEDVKPLEDKYTAQLARPRAAAVLAFAFAFTALTASGIGIFSLLSNSVARRRREFGIRTALGASPSALRWLIWREGLTVTLPGVLIGTLVGLWLTRVLSTLLFEVTSADRASWAIVIGALATTMAAASWRPTRTVVRTPPTVLLREE